MKLSTHQLLNLISLTILIIGILANFLVITENGGRMPVYTEKYSWKSNSHFTYTNESEVAYHFLTDQYKLHGSKIYSLGDILMTLGFFAVTIGNITLMIRLLKREEW